MHLNANFNRLLGSATLLFLTTIRITSAQDAPLDDDWPQFRGPNFNPTAENANLPDTWSTTSNVEWFVEIDGRGWSSPIVSGGKIFLTSVTTDGESKVPQTGTDYSNAYVAELSEQGLSADEINAKVMARDFELPEQVSLHYDLLCFQLATGELLWKKQYHSGQPPGGRHRKNSFASETPVTDGKLVYIYVTHLGLFAYDFSGELIWKRTLENYPVYMQFGTGSSPALLGDKLIIVDDNQEHSTISAYSTVDGSPLWQTARHVPEGYPEQMPKSGWATPYIWNHELRTEIITISPGVAISYDVAGQELWRMTGVTPAPSASSFAYDGMLYLNAGKTKSMYAIHPGATGDITPKNPTEESEFIAWVRPRAGTYIPTPVAYQGGLYVVQDNGIVVRLDSKTGEETFKARLSDPGGSDFTASPWAYNGKIFCASEQGNTFVFEAGLEYKKLQVNRLEELIMSTPAIVGDRLLLRTASRLYSLRSGSSAQ